MRTTEHKCAKCAWQGTGSTDCPNFVPKQKPADLPEYKPAACEDRRGNRCMECADCLAFIERLNHG